MGQGFPGDSVVKKSACNARDLAFDPWVGKIPWKREWLATLASFPGESQEQRNLKSYSPWGCKELDKTK